MMDSISIIALLSNIAAEQRIVIAFGTPRRARVQKLT